jgi:hypothetical protein
LRSTKAPLSNCFAIQHPVGTTLLRLYRNAIVTHYSSRIAWFRRYYLVSIFLLVFLLLFHVFLPTNSIPYPFSSYPFACYLFINPLQHEGLPNDVHVTGCQTGGSSHIVALASWVGMFDKKYMLSLLCDELRKWTTWRG